MLEQLSSIEPHFLTPEYWDGHSKDDNCEWERDKSLTYGQQRQAERFGKKVLSDFFALSDKQPIREFNKGDLFDGTHFPEGTVIKIDWEKIYLGGPRSIKFSDKSSYFSYSGWAVVCGFNIKDIRKSVIIRYLYLPTSFPKPMITPWEWGYLTDTTIEIGKVNHHRKKNIFGKSEELNRVNNADLYKLGCGVKEESKFPLVELRTIFQTP